MSHISSDEASEVKELQDICKLRFDVNHKYQYSDRLKYEAALKKIELYLHTKRGNLAGFQASQSIPGADFGKYIEYHVNNIGDSYQEAPFRLSNKWMERAVVRYYAQMWHAKKLPQLGYDNDVHPNGEKHTQPAPEHDLDEAWGHILTMGCTEGNMYAIRNARDYLQGKYSIFETRPGGVGGLGGPSKPDDPHDHRESRGDESKGYVDLTDIHGKHLSSCGKFRTSVSRAIPIHIDEKAAHTPKRARASSSTHAERAQSRSQDEPHATRISKISQEEFKKFTNPGGHETAEKKPVTVMTSGAVKRKATVDHVDDDDHGAVDSQFSVRTSKEPVILYSTASHYSISKIKDMMEIKTPNEVECTSDDVKQILPEKIRINHDGTTDIDHLIKVAKVLVDNDHPLIIIVNYGTTFTGAHDDPIKIYQELKANNLLKVYHWCTNHPILTSDDIDENYQGDGDGSDAKHALYVRPNFWIHVDGALGSAYGSLFADPADRQHWSKQLKIPLSQIPELPAADFRKNQLSHGSGETTPIESFGPVMSIAMSGHKLLGAPVPTGVIVTLRKYKLDFSEIPYIGSADTTLAGSRSGLATLVMWAQAATRSVQDYAKRYLDAYQMALYAKDALTQHFMSKGIPKNKVPVYHVKGSLAVLFKRPSPELVSKYSLSTDMFVFPGHSDELIDAVHIFCMPHVTKEKIDEICNAM